MLPVQFTLYTVHCTLYTVYCTVSNVHCTLYTTLYTTLYAVHYSLRCTLYTVHCTLDDSLIIIHRYLYSTPSRSVTEHSATAPVNGGHGGGEDVIVEEAQLLLEYLEYLRLQVRQLRLVKVHAHPGSWRLDSETEESLTFYKCYSR